MKNNKVKIYAKALAEVLNKKGIDEKKVIDNFVNLLIKTGQQAKTKKILDLAEEMLLRQQGGRKIVFEIARKLTTENREFLKKFVKEKDIVKEKVNHDLIAGVRVIIDNSKQFDNSLKNKLQNIL